MSTIKGSFQKFAGSPVFGDENTGTVFDAYVKMTPEGRYRMDFSWRPKAALAVTFSNDGIHWEEPAVTLECNPASGWEQLVNRHCVMPDPSGDGWLMWYTGQLWDGDHGKSWIGVARSDDGIHFERLRDKPVLAPESDFEKESVMAPFVLYENGKYRMWYCAGETYEPNTICYAESQDGITWTKYGKNPIFTANPEKEYEQERIGACDILKEEYGYLMFYIGYHDVNTACICAARSPDGITGWERVRENPLVIPTPGAWDSDSCYKPAAVKDSEGLYHIWYNGRRGHAEYIGYATGKIVP